jgi:hypothetical protein
MVPEIFYSVCYGTSQVPPSVAELHAFRPAVLWGYSRRRVRHSDTPGIVVEDADADTGTGLHHHNHRVVGTFVTGLTDALMLKLDYFEGRKYYRKTVEVELLLGNITTGDDNNNNADANTKNNGVGGGSSSSVRVDVDVEAGAGMRTAETYVFHDRSGLEDVEWDLEEFYRDRLQDWAQPGYVQGRKSFLSLSQEILNLAIFSFR